MSICIPIGSFAFPLSKLPIHDKQSPKPSLGRKPTLLNTAEDDAKTLVFAEEFRRSIVKSFVDDEPASEQRETFLDAARQWANEQDWVHGFPRLIALTFRSFTG